MADMMICPKAKECKVIFGDCPYKESHKWSRACAEGHGENCPACIPSPSPEPFKRYAKYEVMKLEDIDKYLTPTQKTNLDDIILSIHKGRIKNGKAPCNHYVVVNEDMPYAEQVWKLIEDYEMTGKPAPQPKPQPLEETDCDSSCPSPDEGADDVVTQMPLLMDYRFIHDKKAELITWLQSVLHMELSDQAEEEITKALQDVAWNQMQAITASQPKYEEQMPLVKNLISYPSEIEEALEAGKIRQRKADWQWHLADKAEAIKQFTEKCIEGMPKVHAACTCGQSQYDACIAQDRKSVV